MWDSGDMVMGEKQNEVKVVFREDNQEKVLRGVISEEDAFFVTLRRNDGTIRIAKSVIIKIDARFGGVGDTNEQRTL